MDAHRMTNRKHSMDAGRILCCTVISIGATLQEISPTVGFARALMAPLLGALQRKEKSEFTMEVGGWVQVSL